MFRGRGHTLLAVVPPDFSHTNFVLYLSVFQKWTFPCVFFFLLLLVWKRYSNVLYAFTTYLHLFTHSLRVNCTASCIHWTKSFLLKCSFAVSLNSSSFGKGLHCVLFTTNVEIIRGDWNSGDIKTWLFAKIKPTWIIPVVQFSGRKFITYVIPFDIYRIQCKFECYNSCVLWIIIDNPHLSVCMCICSYVCPSVCQCLCVKNKFRRLTVW